MKKPIKHKQLSFSAGLIAVAMAITPSMTSAETANSLVADTQISSAHRTYDAATFFNTTDYSIAGSLKHAFSPDGNRLLISSNETGVFNAYALNLETGAQTALTNSTTNAHFAVSYLPDGERILYSADGGGDELTHIYLRNTDGSVQDLTPGEKTKAAFISWTSDQSTFFVQSNERDARVFDLYAYNASDLSRKLIFQNDLALGGLTISDNGRYLAGIKSRTSADNNIYVVDLKAQSPEPKLVTPHEGNISYSVFTFSPDNSALIFGTNEFGEFQQAFSYDIENGDRDVMITDDWDVSYVTYSPSGQYRISATNADGSTRVKIAKRKAKKSERRSGNRTKKKKSLTLKQLNLPAGLPEGDLRQVRFSPNERFMAFGINASNAPTNLFVVDLKEENFRQYTQALNPAMNPDHLVKSKVARYPSFDGLQIPGILYQPKTASAQNPVPALVWVHGGPGGQSRTGYSAAIQHLVNHGYAVFAANNRGSSGYGKTFFHLDDKKHGEGDLQDIVYAKTYLAGLDWVDDDKIGIIGGSYGGFMVVAALAFEPDVFEVGIDIFGVTNWVRTLKSIPPWWESFRESLYDEMGDPAVDEERHRRISPLFHAKNIKKPLLVVQGENDPRVLKIESDEMVAAVRENGVPVEYLVFPDEGHGFLKRENRISASEAYVQFLNTYLKRITE